MDRVVRCDDRLDLYHAILTSNAPWGLDFPFSMPEAGYRALQITNWSGLLDFARRSERNQFNNNSPLSKLACEKKYVPSTPIARDYWRETDIQTNAFSPLAQINPNLLSMTYGGLKLLAYLRYQGERVYPFDQYDGSRSRVYEVYPSNTWSILDVNRQEDIRVIAGLPINALSFSPGNFDVLPNQDAADAVIASVTLAAAIWVHRLENDWSSCPGFAVDAEWKVRKKQQLIVRF